MERSRIFEWYRLAPSFRDALAARVARDRVFLGREPGARLVAGVDGSELVRAGCVFEWRWQRAELVAAVELDVLLAANRGADLGHCLEALEDGRRDGARIWLRMLAGGAEPAAIYLLVKVFGDIRGTRARQRSLAERSLSPAEWVAGAKAWQHLFGDDAEARSWLAEAEARSQSEHDWFACAEGWMSVTSDEAELRRCLEREATKRPRLEPVAEALHGARESLILVGDEGEARRGLEAAMAAATATFAWGACAEAWRTLFADDAMTTECLAQAEARAVDGEDWSRYATLQTELLGHGEEAHAALRRAEERAHDAGAWIQLGRVWGTVFGEPAESRRCLGQAESKSEAAHDWATLAEAWSSILSDETEARRCRLREVVALYAGDRIACARGWKAVLGDGEAARQCLREAQAGAASVDEWSNFASAWREVFSDESEAAHCDEEAKRLRELEEARATGNWLGCARGWKAIYDEPEARRRLKEAEEVARRLSDWTSFALAWKTVFDDTDEARRCMKQAEERARFKSDWKMCAEAWRQVGDYAESQRCSENR